MSQKKKNNQDQQARVLRKKEHREKKRTEKERMHTVEMRRQKTKKITLWIVVGILLIAIPYGIIMAVKKRSASRPGESIPLVKSEHIAFGETVDDYNSNPPTSGSHGEPVPWGFSEKEVLDENAVHNLEHGGIWISYKDLDAASIAVLRDIAARHPGSVLVSPRQENDTAIAVASWRRLMKSDRVDREHIEEYIKRNKNKSPEPFAE